MDKEQRTFTVQLAPNCEKWKVILCGDLEVKEFTGGISGAKPEKNSSVS